MKLSGKILTLLMAVLIVSCASTEWKMIQQMAGIDPDPPEGYKPTYMIHSKKIEKDNYNGATLNVSRIEQYKSDKIRVYLHLIDTNHTYFTGAADAEWKKNWCLVEDEISGNLTQINDFTIEEMKLDREPIACALIMDHSGSMGDKRAQAVQRAVVNFIENKKKDDAVTLVRYDDTVVVSSPITTDKNLLLYNHKIDGLKDFGGLTATADAVVAGINQLSTVKDGKSRVVMVFTDGMDNESKISKDSVIALARATNCIVCCIDYGYNLAPDFMSEIAEATNGTYNHIYGTPEFDMVFKDIYNRLEKFYVLEFEQPEFGKHKLSVRFCGPQKNFTAEAEYDNTPFRGSVTLLDVYFDTGKLSIKSKSNKAIDKVYKMMKANPAMVIEVRGHTDSQGNDDSNMKLSQDRADAVKQVLIDKGIEKDRILSRGFGETMPVAVNTSAAGRAKNRRTEFLVLSQ
ncbi:OmpA family protein [Bacteroidota bacterium]